MNSLGPSSAPVYKPPSSRLIATAQNSPAALRLLLAQRRLYSRAKRWAFMRTIGISGVAVAAPLVTYFVPSASVGMGAVAGAWIFVSRTWFVRVERSYAARGADVQEQFDSLVFSMPQLALRAPRVTPEEISDLVGDDSTALASADRERLKDWYPVDDQLPGHISIAIAQRANAAYSERLLNANANVWLLMTGAWSLLAAVLGVSLGLGLSDFLLGVALPLLPALLDVFEQWDSTRSAGRERRAIADGIERRIRRVDGDAVTGQDLLIWQDQLYDLRRRAPQIPDLVYTGTRRRNELAMTAAAADMASAARSKRKPTGGGQG